MGTRIDTVAARNRLTPRRDPYYQRISEGLFVGYRKMQSGSAGTWCIRRRDEATGKQVHSSLGSLEHLADFQRFDRAADEAKALHSHANAGGVTSPKTVADACSSYITHLRSTKGERAAQDAKQRFDTYVLDDVRFAQLEVQKLKPAHIGDWRKRLADRPIHRGSGRGKNPSKATNKQRSASSLNRDMTPFRAALNHALENAWVTNDFAWRAKLKPIANADNQRAGTYLIREQRLLLIECAKADGSGIEVFIRVLCGLPIRPGALALLQVKDYNSNLNELHIKLDKTEKRKIVLPTSMSEIFAAASADKKPDDILFTRPDGSAWNKDSWKGPIKRAVHAAGLDEKTVMYSLRHAVLSDMIANGVDLLTVSRLSGTSMAMLQRHYGHLIPSVGTAAIASVAI